MARGRKQLDRVHIGDLARDYEGLRVVEQLDRVQISDLVRDYETLRVINIQDEDAQGWIGVVLGCLANLPFRHAVVILTLTVLGWVLPKAGGPWSIVVVTLTIVLFSTGVLFFERYDGQNPKPSCEDDSGTKPASPGEVAESQR
jgi:hypothetical protein